MENLKVWDTIYSEWRWLAKGLFYIEEIERITKTLIITKSWKKLKNLWEKALSGEWFNTIYYFIFDEEAKLRKQNADKIQKIEAWFHKKNFSIEEKEQVYNLLNK